MIKVLAVLRTVFLVFIVGYTVRALPFWSNVARTFDEQYARCAETLALVGRAAWIAVGWIALETVIGWIMATRARPRPPKAKDMPPPRTSEPPFAPPGHR